MRGRLYICRSGRFIGAWSAKRNTRGQWLQVTTSKEAIIRDAYKEYVVVLHSVSRYRLSLLKYWFDLLPLTDGLISKGFRRLFGPKEKH